MSDQFVAEIRMFAGNFPPAGWAFCNGQFMTISQNTALFSLLGTVYGGNGNTTFALPNLQGCAPMMWGQGPGLTDRSLGESSGSPTVTVLSSEMPTHNHSPKCNNDDPSATTPTGTVWAVQNPNSSAAYGNAVAQTLTQMNPMALSVAGSGFPHNNMQPYLGLTFIIALQGVFPPRQ